jgi:hypothetical protein
MWSQSFSGNVEVYVDVPVTPGTVNGQFNLFFLSTVSGSSSNGYRIRFTQASPNANWAIIRFAPTATTVAGPTNISGQFAAGDSVGATFAANGVITVYRKTGGTWSALGTYTDSSPFLTGFIGLETNDAVTAFDNFGGGVSILPAPTLYGALFYTSR